MTIIRRMRPLLSAVGAVWRAAVLVAVAVTVSAVAQSNALAYDVVVYVPAEERVLEGEPPFPGLDDPVLHQNAAYAYPPQAALLATPLTVLPRAMLEVVGVVASVAALFGALLLLGVLWPLVVRFLATWRVWAGTVAVAITVATALVSWAIIGFRGLTSYPALLSKLAEIETADTQA